LGQKFGTFEPSVKVNSADAAVPATAVNWKDLMVIVRNCQLVSAENSTILQNCRRTIALSWPNRTDMKGASTQGIDEIAALRSPSPRSVAQSRRNDSHPGPADKGRALDFLQNSAHSIR
jgi:hypothetical protein